MAMYISIDDQRLRIKRSDKEVGGTFWEVEPQNASCVFEVAWGAKQENEEKYGYIYKVLKRGGRSLSLHRNNEYADALIFAATGVTQALKAELSEYDLAWKEAHDRNNCGEGEEFFELYAS